MIVYLVDIKCHKSYT